MRTFLGALAAAALLGAAVPAGASRGPSTLAVSADSVVARGARGGRFWGAVLVARRGRPVFEKAYGLADLAWGLPNTVDTRFEIASLTKQFTGMAIAQLAAQGKLALDDPVGKYYAGAPPAWDGIKIEQLLTHTSGLPGDELKDFPKGIAVPYTPDELIATFRDRPLVFEPGTRWRYTNTEYYLLAWIIEKLSGESYGRYLERHIFGPLGMKDSGFSPTTAVVRRLAVGYTPEGDSLRQRGYFDRSLEIGAGGVHSTLGDLLRWDRALETERLVPRAYRDSIFSARNPGDYGYGWFVQRRGGSLREWHEGSDPGYGAFILRRPEEGLLIVVLSNVENAPVRSIAEGLEACAGARRVEPPGERGGRARAR